MTLENLIKTNSTVQRLKNIDSRLDSGVARHFYYHLQKSRKKQD